MGRPKENRGQLQVRVDPKTPAKLKKIALNLGFLYAGNCNTGKFLDAIADLEPSQFRKLLKK